MYLATTSLGVWKKRLDLQNLFPAMTPIHPLLQFSSRVNCYCGWGRKKSGLAALRLAQSRKLPFALLEDGFLRSYFPGEREPSASYVVDNLGIYYDSFRPNKLEQLIAGTADSGELIERAKLALNEIRSRKLSKYNSSGVKSFREMGLNASEPYVLLIDQVEGDASIHGSGARDSAFSEMLADAARDWPKHQLVIRAHPASNKRGPLELAALQSGIGVILKQASNIWTLLEDASHVYTVSSLVGFEALMAGRPVSCYGTPFYAGWGITSDKLHAPRRQTTKNLFQVFAAAYISYSQYLGLHDRKLSTIENTIDELTVVRDARERNRGKIVTIGMSYWKRRAVKPFLVGEKGFAQHFASIKQVKGRFDHTTDVGVAIWGSREISESLPENWRVVRMEDGFLRSVGLGAALNLPLSLVREDNKNLYFDARGPSSIERHIIAAQASPRLQERASRLRKTIIEGRATKYMLPGRNTSEDLAQLPRSSRTKILVTGQVEADASIRFGSPEVRTNTALITAVRKLFPDAVIAYREHPDVARGLRHGKADRSLADVNADYANINDLFEWCDRVETMTSLSGFEALIRGKQVGVHGWPFYAGWGLTDDRLVRPQRGIANIDELVAASLILYPDYIHPASRMPCTAESLVLALSQPASLTFEEKYVFRPAGLVISCKRKLTSVASRTMHKIK